MRKTEVLSQSCHLFLSNWVFMGKVGQVMMLRLWLVYLLCAFPQKWWKMIKALTAAKFAQVCSKSLHRNFDKLSVVVFYVHFEYLLWFFRFHIMLNSGVLFTSESRRERVCRFGSSPDGEAQEYMGWLRLLQSDCFHTFISSFVGGWLQL